MQNFRDAEIYRMLLDRLMGAIHTTTECLYHIDRDGMIDPLEASEIITGIDPNGGIQDVRKKPVFFYPGCGHAYSNNIGGQCGCGAICCNQCYLLCVICGVGTCPRHRIMDESGPLCVNCCSEIKYSKKKRQILRGIASIFIDGIRDEKKERHDV